MFMNNRYIFHKTGIICNESNIRSLSLLQSLVSTVCMITAIFIKKKWPYFQILTY